jgi:hypothetical protein
MRKQKGRIQAEVFFGELVRLSHQIRSVGVPQGDIFNDTPPGCSGAGAEPLASAKRLQKDKRQPRGMVPGPLADRDSQRRKRGEVSPSGAASIPELAHMVSDAQERDIASNFLGPRGLDASAFTCLIELLRNRRGDPIRFAPSVLIQDRSPARTSAQPRLTAHSVVCVTSSFSSCVPVSGSRNSNGCTRPLR